MGEPTVRIRLLGGLAIDRPAGAGRAAALPGRRCELLFAYLVVEHRRTVSRDELADTLWPGMLPDSWAAAVRGVITDVRRFLEASSLEPDVLSTERSGYRLRLPSGAVVDFDEAREALAAARACVDAGDAAGAAQSASRAQELAALPFLPHHDSEWVDGIRAELESLRIAALELHVRASAEAGDARAAAALAERLVRAEPFNEVFHRLWIGALADCGDRAGARRVYAHCREVLADELGIEPSAETVALLQRALVEPQPEAAPAAPRAPAAVPGGFAELSVLVVEDHDFQRRTALTLLRGLGVGALDEAADGHAALALLAAAAPPDVIICDIDMPGMDGVEFIREVAARGLASAVAIASALDARLLRAIQAVCEGYGLQVLGAVEKPLTVRRLSELLAAYRRPTPADAGQRHAAVAGDTVADALARGQIVADFQPIVDLASGRVSAGQAVARLQDREGAPISPPELVAAVDREGLTLPFVDRIVELACEELQQLSGETDAIDLWIELPRSALADATIAERLIDLVRARQADPQRIVCVFDGQLLRTDPLATLDVLTRLRVKGFGLCFDGFGGGHVAEEQLERLPITAVRLDARLVCGAAVDAARMGDLQEAIDVAGVQQLVVVGDGCASAADFELLLQLGCGYGQGPFFADALPAAQFPGWAAQWRPPPLQPEESL